ncbi:hypothetical protein DICPUDRAFT_73427, partial [Dictyostelium purpureum]
MNTTANNTAQPKQSYSSTSRLTKPKEFSFHTTNRVRKTNTPTLSKKPNRFINSTVLKTKNINQNSVQPIKEQKPVQISLVPKRKTTVHQQT